MIDSREAARRPVRAPLRQRSRRRWAIAGGVVACWLAAEVITGSVAAATVVVVAVAALGVVVVAGLRAMGITRDHPALQRVAARPWRDGQDVLGVALRHLPEVFVVTPSGSLFAPEFVELQMSPGDIASLREWMELDAVCASATEAYEDQVARHKARFAGPSQPEVYIVPDDSLPQGRYRLRRGLPANTRYSPDAWDLPDVSDGRDARDARDARDGRDAPAHRNADQGYAATSLDPAVPGPGSRTRLEVNPGQTIMDGMATVMEQIRPAVPLLRLVTGSSVAETSTSGARAGRGMVELELPDVPTVSRVHATFTFAAGRWWVANQGMNGLSVSGVSVSGKHPLTDGDSIRWGSRPDAPLSKVEIG
jgi:hypothetical protein